MNEITGYSTWVATTVTIDCHSPMWLLGVSNWIRDTVQGLGWISIAKNLCYIKFLHLLVFFSFFSFFCIPRSEDPQSPALLCSVPGSWRLPRLPQPGRLANNRTKVRGKERHIVSSCTHTD
jgi:hypothetical protein